MLTVDRTPLPPLLPASPVPGSLPSHLTAPSPQSKSSTPSPFLHPAPPAGAPLPAPPQTAVPHAHEIAAWHSPTPTFPRPSPRAARARTMAHPDPSKTSPPASAKPSA